MDWITPLLAVGSLAEAQDMALLQASGIEAVLSLEAVDLSFAPVAQLYLNVKDRGPVAIESLQKGIAFLKAQIEQGHPCLLHCQMGISRSPSFAIAYLASETSLSWGEASRLVRERRPVADPHPVLMSSIEDCLQAGGER